MDEQQEDMWVRTGAQLQAARKMLAVLKAAETVVPIYMRGNLLSQITEAIEQAEKAGINTGDE